MQRIPISKVLLLVIPVLVVAAGLAITLQNRSSEAGAKAETTTEPPSLRRDGAFGFPQQEAEVLYDGPDFRLSAWTDAQNVALQAIFWDDDDDDIGRSEDGGPIGDWSTARLDVDADGRDTAKVDRNYMLDFVPKRPGMNYQLSVGGGKTYHPNPDSKGTGAIRYLDDGTGRLIRVDTFVIPLEELGRKPGDRMRLAFWAQSPIPPYTVNSVGFQPPGEVYWSYHLPRTMYHEIVLQDRSPRDFSKVPDGRVDAPPKPETGPLVEIGAVPPPLDVPDWSNIDPPPTLESLRGKVVLIDFWKSRCATCVKLVPHLNRIHAQYKDQGLVLLAITTQDKKWIEKFMEVNPIRYAVGMGSTSQYDYGIPSIPYSFVIGRDGMVKWRGSPADEALGPAVTSALAE